MSRKGPNYCLMTNGFSLVEVVLVTSVIGILTKIASPIAINTIRTTEAKMARYSLSNIARVCKTVKDLEFNKPIISGYTFTPGANLNCDVKTISALSKDIRLRPNYYLDLEKGLISCKPSTGQQIFKDCPPAEITLNDTSASNTERKLIHNIGTFIANISKISVSRITSYI